MKPRYIIGELVKTPDIKRFFWKTDTSNWSYKLYEITEKTNDTILSYRLDSLPERYNEALLKKTNSSMKENKDVMKALNLE